MAVNALYASLFEPDLAALQLEGLPSSRLTGPDYLNVLRFLDVPQAVAMAAERIDVRLHQSAGPAWDYPAQVAAKCGWVGKFRVEGTGEEAPGVPR